MLWWCSCSRFSRRPILPVAGSYRQGQDAGRLNDKIAELTDLLSLEKLDPLSLEDQLSQLRAGLASAEAERDRVKGLYEGLAGAGDGQPAGPGELDKELDRKSGARRGRCRRSRC